MTKQESKQIAEKFFGTTQFKMWRSYNGNWTFCACEYGQCYGHMFMIDNGEMIIKN